MKLSNKILLLTGIILLVILTGLMLRFKGIMNDLVQYRHGASKEEYDKMLQSETISKEFAIQDFAEIDLDINANINIIKSSEYKVIVEAPQELINSATLQVKKEGGQLKITCPNYRRSFMGDKIDIEIKTPEIEELEISNSAIATIDNFQLDQIEIKLAGNCKLTGNNNIIEDLELSCFGAADVDFKACKITNAEIQTFGSNSIEINMAGGILEGSMTGSGIITYYGRVNKENIKTLGSTKVIKKTL